MTQVEGSGKSTQQRHEQKVVTPLSTKRVGQKLADASLWTDKYAPNTMDELVINKKKI